MRLLSLLLLVLVLLAPWQAARAQDVEPRDGAIIESVDLSGLSRDSLSPGLRRELETLTGEQSFSPGKGPLESHTPYARIDIGFDTSVGSPQAELEALQRKMNDPKTTAADRNAAMLRMVQIQTKMLEEMTKAMKTDPASLNKAQDDFGCGLVQMYPDKGVIVDGNIICGTNFHGGNALKVTGTMTQVR